MSYCFKVAEAHLICLVITRCCNLALVKHTQWLTDTTVLIIIYVVHIILVCGERHGSTNPNKVHLSCFEGLFYCLIILKPLFTLEGTLCYGGFLLNDLGQHIIFN